MTLWLHWRLLPSYSLCLCVCVCTIQLKLCHYVFFYNTEARHMPGVWGSAQGVCVSLCHHLSALPTGRTLGRLVTSYVPHFTRQRGPVLPLVDRHFTPSLPVSFPPLRPRSEVPMNGTWDGKRRAGWITNINGGLFAVSLLSLHQSPLLTTSIWYSREHYKLSCLWPFWANDYNDFTIENILVPF